jgi:hypothetical protein
MNAEVEKTTGEAEQQHEYGVLFWVGTVIGWAIIIYGARLLVADDEAEWFNTVRLVAIGIIAHDVVWLAVSVGGGWLLTRVIGREIPFWIRWGGWTTAIIVAMWLPVGRRYGDRLNNATILPRNYTNSIIILLAVIWVSAAAYGIIAAQHSKRSQNAQASEG